MQVHVYTKRTTPNSAPINTADPLSKYFSANQYKQQKRAPGNSSKRPEGKNTSTSQRGHLTAERISRSDR